MSVRQQTRKGTAMEIEVLVGDMLDVPADVLISTANPWLQTFVTQMSSPYSVTPALTTHESEFEAAEATATEDIAERTKTPAEALAYIDSQSNNGAGG